MKSSNQVPGLSHLGPLPAMQNRGGKDGWIPAGMDAGGEGPGWRASGNRNEGDYTLYLGRDGCGGRAPHASRGSSELMEEGGGVC